MSKKLFYRIGEACKLLEIQPYVLRYWETEFPFLSPTKSKSGQRTYNERELEIIRRIKELLYEEGYTIAGAKKKLETEIAETSRGETKEPAKASTAAKASVKQDPEALETHPVNAKAETAGEDAEPSAEDTRPPAKKAPARKTVAKQTAASRRKTKKEADEPAEPAKQAAPEPTPVLDTASGDEIEKWRSGVEAALSQTRSILELLAH